MVGVGKPVTVKGRGLGDYMSKTTWIASVARSVCVVALFMGALPAYADTITGAYTVGGTAVQGGAISAPRLMYSAAHWSSAQVRYSAASLTLSTTKLVYA